MQWRVDAWHGYPLHPNQQKLVHIRVIEADPRAQKQLAQIIVRFDSDQVRCSPSLLLGAEVVLMGSAETDSDDHSAQQGPDGPLVPRARVLAF